MSRMVSFSVLVGIIVIIGFLFYRVMAGFLLPLFLAALLVVMFRPLHRWYLVKCKGRPRLAAGLTTASVMLIVLVPATLAITRAAVDASVLVGRLNEGGLNDKLKAKRVEFGLYRPYANELRYFEASFERLVERTSGGSMETPDRESLAGLATSLSAFNSELEARSHDEALLSSFATVVERFEQAVSPPPQGERGIVEYHQLFEETAAAFRRFKVEFLSRPYQPPPEAPAGAPAEADLPLAAKLVTGLIDLVNQKQLTANAIELVNPSDEEIEELKRTFLAGASGWFRSVGGATGALAAKLLFGMFIMVISLHFFLSDGPSMVTTFMRLSPLDDRHEQELLDEFDRVSRAVVVATLLSAVVQGLLGGIGYWFADVGAVLLLTVLTTVFALIPFVGAAAIWVPVCLYLILVEEQYLAGGLLALYGCTVVSMADNVIKPLVLHGQSNLHPLLALLSVLGGVQALGPIGVLVGPMVVVFLQTLLNILHRELTTLE